MKILIFSDSHLYDEFDEKKYKFLKKLIVGVDQVIINGDFWDGYICSFSEFINSPWNQLFPLLKKKKTIYIYGNHDRKLFSDDSVSLFSDIQVDEFSLEVNKIIYNIEHGNKKDISLSRLDELLFNRKKPIRPLRYVVKYVKKLVGVGLKVFGKPLLKKMYQRFNDEIKLQIKNNIIDYQMYVFGHTHLAEIDEETHFINTGIVQHGLGQYLIIDETGFKLQEEWYSEDKL